MTSEELGELFPIIIVDYDPAWPGYYRTEADFLNSRFSDVIISTEHYGSTSIPGLAAKPCIDILVEITSFEEVNNKIVPVLEELNYGHDSYKGHIAFFKGYFPVNESLKYHLHMAPLGHPLFDGLLFRDYLRTHPEKAKEYEALKYHLAQIYRTDREAYTEAKGDFVKEIIDLAKAK